jgi:deoxyribonuclease-4
MVILGAHMSIAGGYYKAVERASEAGCDCVQVFTKNNNQWRAKEITDDDVAKFRHALDECEISHSLSHASYLINLASPDRALWTKSRDAMVVELHRAEQLGIPFVVLHPGSFTTSSEAQGIEQIALALNEIHQQTSDIGARCLLENTAGQGTNLGWRFEQLGAILSGVSEQDRIGVCLDTCHLFAAGYPLTTRDEFSATCLEFDRLVGLDRIQAFHLNDSKRELGSRVDRHENLGEGCLGLEPFRHLVNDDRFRRVPMYLETPKGKNPAGDDWDQVNLAALRALIA